MHLMPALGELYPWPLVRAYAASPAHHRRVQDARRALDHAADTDAEWALSVSGGKDSTALALLCEEEGWRVPMVSVKDDLDYPDERPYVEALATRVGAALDLLTPEVSLQAWLTARRASLIEPLHAPTAPLSATHFYGALRAHREARDLTGVLLGLRSEESRARRLNVATRGTVYTRRDGLTVAQPLAHWTALDVHAFLAVREQPLLDVYQCIDPGMDPFSLRKSWWVVGGGPATHGHYGWLRRWWPAQWRAAVAIDPNVLMLT